MFGSNFMANFGIPDFAFQNADVQGGLFGSNVPVQSPMSQNDAPQGAATPIAGQPSPAGPAALSPSSPLSSASLGRTATGSPQPMTPDASPMMTEQAPAAGIGSPFGRPNG